MGFAEPGGSLDAGKCGGAVTFTSRYLLRNCNESRLHVSVNKDRNFKPKNFTDITRPAKLFVTQILAKITQVLTNQVLLESMYLGFYIISKKQHYIL